MADYQLHPEVLIQRNSIIPANQSLSEFLRSLDDETPFDHKQSFTALSRRGRIYTLNLTASIILEELLRGTSCDDVASLLGHLFCVSKEQARADIDQARALLVERGILRDCPD